MKVNYTHELPDGILHVYTYAELDAGRLPEGCAYFEQVTQEGKRYKGRDGKPGSDGTGGGVLVIIN